MLMRNTSPQAVGSVARGVAKDIFNTLAPEAIAEGTPRFRGVFYVPGKTDGTINGERMNLNDWVYYAGPGGEWYSNYLYRWIGSKWEPLPRPSENVEYGWMYLDCISSITEGAPLGWFSDVFCKAITTAIAFIKYLYMQNGILRDGGSIQSETYRPGSSGCIIHSNGDVEFWNGKFHGRIEATEGYFHGRIEGQEGYFRGKLCVGQRWDINGNNNNTSAIGFYVPDTGSPTSYLAKITSLYAETSFKVGDGSRDTYENLNRTIITHTGKTHTETRNVIRQTFSSGAMLTALNTAIRNLIGESTIGYEVPINGTIAGTGNDVNNPSNSATGVVVLTSMEYLSAGYYRLHGKLVSGPDVGNDIYIDCTGYTGTAHIKANFVIL